MNVLIRWMLYYFNIFVIFADLSNSIWKQDDSQSTCLLDIYFLQSTLLRSFSSFVDIHLEHSSLPLVSYFQLGLKSFPHSSQQCASMSIFPLSSFFSLFTHISSPNRTKNSLLVADGKKLTSDCGGVGVAKFKNLVIVFYLAFSKIIEVLVKFLITCDSVERFVQLPLELLTFFTISLKTCACRHHFFVCWGHWRTRALCFHLFFDTVLIDLWNTIFFFWFSQR